MYRLHLQGYMGTVNHTATYKISSFFNQNVHNSRTLFYIYIYIYLKEENQKCLGVG